MLTFVSRPFTIHDSRFTVHDSRFTLHGEANFAFWKHHGYYFRAFRQTRVRTVCALGARKNGLQSVALAMMGLAGHVVNMCPHCLDAKPQAKGCAERNGGMAKGMNGLRIVLLAWEDARKKRGAFLRVFA